MEIVAKNGVDGFVEAFDRLNETGRPNGRIGELRKAGITALQAVGFPGRKDEAWKYTPITRVLPDTSISFATPDLSQLDIDVASLRIPGLHGPIVVVVDGEFSSHHSDLSDLPDGVAISSLRDSVAERDELLDRYLGKIADPEHQAFEALNTAFLDDGVFLHVKRGIEAATPIQVLTVTTGQRALVQPRLLFVAEEASAVTIVENQRTLGDGDVFTNAVCEVFAARDARVDHYRIQTEGGSATQVCTTRVNQSGTSNVSTFTATFGGKLVRNNLHILPDAEYCETHLNGLFLASGTQHIDNHTFVDHARPNCESNELYKGILDGSATGVFNGKVLVRRDAQKTNAYQSNKSIVLSDSARMYAKPELEIYADDVKCSHGATTGQVDAEALFYLQSRGISRDKAMTMMLGAFAGDVLSLIQPEAVRSYVESLVGDSLAEISRNTIR